MDCSTPGFPVRHQLLEFIQIHVHCVSDAIQPSHPRGFSLIVVFTQKDCQGRLIGSIPTKCLEQGLVRGETMLNCEPVVLSMVRRNQRLTEAGTATLRAM